jgi:1,4-dihydroxy-2-naphthoate octaprenyltransferase
MKNAKLQAWLYAFRLRTLPLAFSSIITGSSIAFAHNRENFNWIVFVLCLVTTLFLQILSNLANDYGDSEKGTDNDERIGPKRAIQAGMLSVQEIKVGIALATGFSLIAGVALVHEAFLNVEHDYTFFFLLLGFAAMAAAIKYTIGKGAYGYSGWGDAFVILFFGIVGVGGSYYLLAHRIDYAVILPALSIGFFSAGVLNLNNMRDNQSDAKAGKNTLAVKLGLQKARVYHRLLIIVGMLLSVVYVLVSFVSTMQLLFIITAPLFRKHLVAVNKVAQLKDFDPLLKQLAISTFIFSVLFALGQVLGE